MQNSYYYDGDILQTLLGQQTGYKLSKYVKYFII